MSDFFTMVLESGLSYGFLIGFICWGFGKGLSIGLNLFEV